ncbi:band 7 family-domain-containing protein [Globomyces pollinis-pini]|nr:band 7 family-domain-containing protein [Globomyces pollinis-pini]
MSKGKEKDYEHDLEDGTDDWSVPKEVKNNPLFMEIETGSNVVETIKKLDAKMMELNHGRLISLKTPNSLLGNSVPTGNIGLFDRAGRPQIVIEPGLYLNLNPTLTWKGTIPITSHVEFLGLTIAQVGQSEAMVVQDPHNRVFVIRNGGFVAYGIEGTFKILQIVDTLNLGDQYAIRELHTNRILGWKQEVHTLIRNGTNMIPVPITVATFINVPANNVAILQQADKIIVLEAGQHVITNPHTTFRDMFSLGERQHPFKTQPAYTSEGVPVILDINLRYRVFDPVLLTVNYDDPLLALINPAQSAVNSVVSRLSYQQFMRAKKVGPEVTSNGSHVPWVEAFKSECMKELQEDARKHGIHVLSFEIMDRQLQGSLGKDLERQAETILQNQIEATQIELRNHINTEKERGILQVARVEAESIKTQSDTNYYRTTKQADAKYYEMMKQAAAKAETAALVTQQEAKNIVSLAEANRRQIELQAEAYASVPAGHAQNIQRELLEVEKRYAMPDKSVWFESQGEIPGSVIDGYNVAKGVMFAKG